LIPVLLAIGEVILWAVAGGVAGALIGLAVEALVEALSGKSVAVIGERTAGKTTLAKFFSSGVLPEKYEQTLSENRLDGRTIQLSELKLKVSEINDVPGDKDFYKQWKEAVNRADIVYYLARADKALQSADTRKRILNDVKHLGTWSKENPGKRIFFVGTHCDLVPAYSKLSSADRGDFQDTFFKLEELREVALRLRELNAGLILGSLGTERGIQQVVHQSFQKIVADKK
jgi:GTPase SAR1 family protein